MNHTHQINHPARHSPTRRVHSPFHPSSFVLHPFVIALIACHIPPAAAATPPPDAAIHTAEALEEFEQAQQVQAADPQRARQLFRSAARRFEGVIASGVVNGKLEYNLGNAYLQAGDIGKAILHYRRAERLIPGDPLLHDNLRLARSRCLTSITPSRRSSLMRGIFFLHYQTSQAVRVKLALAMYLLFWVLLAIRTAGWRRLLEYGLARRTAAVGAVVSGLASLSLFLSLGADALADRYQKPGVVIATDVSVQKGPGTGYQRQFVQPLQAGVEFTLLERRAEWWRIELADGKTGWIERDNAELVIQ